MRDMTLLILGLLIFLGLHSVSIFAPAWRDAQVAQRGENAWKGIYSLLSIVGFALLVYGYGQSRLAPVVLYTPPTALRHVALLLMVPVFVLLLAAYLPGRIKTAAKHPMLLATKLWATAHLLANGNLGDVLLFGGFLAWAVLDRIAVGKRTVQRKPVVTAAPSRMNDVLAIVGGLVLYVVVIAWAHQRFIGVPPLLPH
jgi:uncharacterized membrane protein